MKSRAQQLFELADYVQEAPVQTAAVAADMPNFALFFEPARRWMVNRDLGELIAEFCAERDCGDFGAGYGSRDFRKKIVLYRMCASRREKRAIGVVHYNGNVQSSEVLS